MNGYGKQPVKTKYEWKKREIKGNQTNVKELNPVLNGRGFYSGEMLYNFGFSGSGISFGFKGTSLEIDFNGCGSWFGIYIDGKEITVVSEIEKPGFQPVCEGLETGKIHEVTIGRRNEGNGSAALSQIAGIKISEGGEFYVKKYKTERRKMEILGDSISCGWGNLHDPAKPTDNVAEMEDGTRTFATMLADYYDAELRMACISGIGIGNSANSPWPLLPVYKGDAGGAYDVVSNVPDLVIIELGTNDSACGNTGDEFVENGKKYISFIRGNYPDAVIIWYYGIMGTDLKPQIEKIVKTFTDSGDDKIYTLFTVQKEEEGIGGAGHPSMKTHERMAKELEELINKVVKWSV